MGQGEAWAKARVTIAGNRLDGVLRAVIESGNAVLSSRDGTIIRTMPGPIELSGFAGNSVTWSNGDESWYIKKAGCSCNGDEP